MRYLFLALLAFVLAACDYSLQPEVPLESTAILGGTFDTSFGNNGQVVLSTPEEDSVADVTVQGDGKILALGTTQKQIGTSFTVARLNLNGTPDPSFGTGGHAFPTFTLIQPVQAVAISLHSSGTLCTLGQGIDSHGAGAQIDCFGSNGINRYARVPRTQTTQEPYNLFVSDFASNFVITEHPHEGGGAWFSYEGAVTVGATFHQAGKRDQFWLYRDDYASNTIKETSISFTGLDAQFRAFAVANNGDIFMVGRVRDSAGKTKMAVAKVNKDGVLLAKQIHAFTKRPVNSEGTDIALDSSGRVLVTGLLLDTLTPTSFVARLNPTTLALDMGYGSNGLTVLEQTATGQGVKASKLEVDAQDRAVVVGQAFDPGIVVDDPGPGTEVAATIAPPPPPIAKRYVWVSRVSATG